MSVAEEKRVLRQKLKALERTLSADCRQRSERAIVASLLRMDAYRNAQSVCCFVGTAHEIDTRPLLLDALSNGKRLCVPRCAGRGVMDMRRVLSLDELRPGVMGILEPSADAETVAAADIDFLIAPCLACDRRGNRLGRGGGYYDRFLSEYKGASVTLCREAMLQDSIPMEDYDKAVPLVLSEIGAYHNGNFTPARR